MFKNNLFLLPILFISGCSVSGMNDIEISCQEYNTKPNFYNLSLKKEYDQEKSFYLNETPNNGCKDSYNCKLLARNDRWDFIEIYIKEDKNLFSKKDSYYKIYRDYTLKNCMTKEQYSDFSENLFKNKNGAFCLSAEEIEKPKSKIEFQRKIEDGYYKDSSYSNYSKSETNIIVNGNLFLSFKNIAYRDNRGFHTCKNMDETYIFISKEFN